MQIYHNPRCRKSRETLNIIQENGFEPEIILYLENMPEKNILKSLLDKLNIPAENLIRKNEDVYKTTYKGKSLSEEEWIDAMITHPKLMERPIVVKGDKAVLGRPPENVRELF